MNQMLAFSFVAGLALSLSACGGGGADKGASGLEQVDLEKNEPDKLDELDELVETFEKLCLQECEGSEACDEDSEGNTDYCADDCREDADDIYLAVPLTETGLACVKSLNEFLACYAPDPCNDDTSFCVMEERRFERLCEEFGYY